MEKIGIIAAMQEELESIKNITIITNVKKIKNISFIEGIINDKEVILVLCGVGKVNAAMITQLLIDNYNIKEIINIGCAGALNSELNIGDIVIGDKLVQHDFDITAFGHKKGYITDIGEYIHSARNILDKMVDTIKDISNKEYTVKVGTIATGDIFCTDVKMKNNILQAFNAQCVEMEGAAIAQVCYLNNIPFIVIRSISDTPNGNNAIVFDEFIKLASKRCAEFLKQYI